MGKKCATLYLCLLFLSSGLWSGGWNNTLMGIRALGIGAAYVGLADDPSAIFYNPAGLILQKNKLNFSINGLYVMPVHEFSADGLSARSEERTSIPQVFITYKTSDRITFGFGVYAPYATGGVNWREEDLGTPLNSYLGILSLTPSVSYQISEKLSIGFNVNIYHSVLEVDTKTEFGQPLETKENGSAITAGLGLMYSVNDKLRIGVTVRGPATMKISGTTSLAQSVPGVGTVHIKRDSETEFKLPWDFEIGFSYRFSDRLVLSTSAQYTMWSVLDSVRKSIKDFPLVGDMEIREDLNFKNILVMRAGIEYMIPGGIFLRGGLGVDRAAQPSETLSPNNIDVDKFTLLGGIGYRTGNTQIDFVYIMANGRERDKTQSYMGFPFTETYNLSASILGLGVTFSF
ncbi:MAG: outer membrane protein transport protein [Candidatus Aminicenantes bacterium]|nr:outer membrane protein transport protein [Candidatus Aminicenantes bacterium]